MADKRGDQSALAQNAPDQGARVPKVEVLYFAGCPNYMATVQLVHDALLSEGLTAPVELVAVETQEVAERERFYGSPTVRINGRDVAPPTDVQARPALACRVYRGSDGRLAPAPPVTAILTALRNF